MTRFFVPNRGVTHQWTVKEMAAHDDFVYLDMSATYQTIGSQVVRDMVVMHDCKAFERSSSPHHVVTILACRYPLAAQTATTRSASRASWMPTGVCITPHSWEAASGVHDPAAECRDRLCFAPIRATSIGPTVHDELDAEFAPQIAVFERVVAAHDVAFVLKTDDDSFVNVPALVADLRSRCTSADCAAEKLYMGYQVTESSRALTNTAHATRP